MHRLCFVFDKSMFCFGFHESWFVLCSLNLCFFTYTQRNLDEHLRRLVTILTCFLIAQIGILYEPKILVSEFTGAPQSAKPSPFLTLNLFGDVVEAWWQITSAKYPDSFFF